MHGRAQALLDRIAQDAVDFGLGVDLVVAEVFLEDLIREHPGGEDALRVEAGEREGCPVLRPEDPGEDADLAHGDRDRGGLGRGGQVQDPRGLGQVRGRGGDLDHVRVELLALLGDVADVDRRGLHVVVADDPLGLAEPTDLGGDVHLEVDVIDPQGDGLPEELLALVFVAAPEAAVDAAADREDEWRRPVLEDPLQVGIPPEAIDAQLDQIHAGLGRFLPFLRQRRMPPTTDRHADHRPIRPRAGAPPGCLPTAQRQHG